MHRWKVKTRRRPRRRSAGVARVWSWPWSLIGLGLLAFLGTRAAAAIINLTPGAAGSVAAALAAAADGDTIKLAPGTYLEHDLRPSRARLTLEGATGRASDVTLDANGAGRILTLGDAAVGLQVRHLTLRNGSSWVGGCALVDMAANTSSGVLFANVAFENCRSLGKSPPNPNQQEKSYTERAGGAVYFARTSAPRFQGCSFRHNVAALGGGAAWTHDDSAPVFVDCVWERNSVTAGFGGAMVPESRSAPYVLRNVFRWNVAGAGGAVDTGGTTKAKFEECIFEENDSPFGGGAVYHYGNDRTTFTRCRFERNRAGSGGGGAVLVSTTCFPRYTDCYFADNSVSLGAGQGGAVMMTGNPGLTLIGGSMLRSESFNGGAIYARGTVVLRIDGLLADGGTSLDVGGGFMAVSGGGHDISITNSVIRGFSAKASAGGGFRMTYETGSTKIENTTITNCTSAYGGGGFYLASAAKIALRNVTILGNSAEEGAGIMATENAEVIVHESRIEGNAAAANGGGFSVDRNTYVKITRSAIIGNSAKESGGGLYVAGGRGFSLEECLVSENRARRGGAAALSPRLLAPPSVSARATVFRKNVALVSGGALHLAEGTFPFNVSADCSFEANEARWGPNRATRPQRIAIAGNDSFARAPGEPFEVRAALFDGLGQLVTLVEPPATVALSGSAGLALNALVSTRVFAEGAVAFTMDVEGLLGRNYTVSLASDFGTAPVVVQVLPCRAGFAPVTTADSYRCVPCASGTFNLDGGPCLPCPPGASCPGRATLLADTGFWLNPESLTLGAPSLHRCPRRASVPPPPSLLPVPTRFRRRGFCCPRGRCPVDDQCASAREGVLCGACKPGYSDWGGVCAPCAAPQYGLLLIPAVVAALIVGIFWITSIGLPTSGKLKSVVFFIQAAALIISDVQVVASLSWDSLLSSSVLCPFQIEPIQRTLLGYWIPAFSFVFLLLAVLLVYVAAALRHRRLSPLSTEVQRRLFVTAVQIATFAYIAIARTSMNFLDCATVGNMRVLRRSPAVSCTDASYRRWLPLAWTMIAGYVIAVPLLVFLAVFRLVKKKGTKEMYEGGATRLTWGVLYACYRPSWKFYEVFFMARRIVLIAMDSAFGNDDNGRALGMFFACSLFIAVHEACQPFLSRLDNAIETLFLQVLLLTAALEIAATAAFVPPSYSIRGIQYGMNALALLVGLLLIVLFFARYVRALYGRTGAFSVLALFRGTPATVGYGSVPLRSPARGSVPLRSSAREEGTDAFELRPAATIAVGPRAPTPDREAGSDRDEGGYADPEGAEDTRPPESARPSLFVDPVTGGTRWEPRGSEEVPALSAFPEPAPLPVSRRSSGAPRRRSAGAEPAEIDAEGQGQRRHTVSGLEEGAPTPTRSRSLPPQTPALSIQDLSVGVPSRMGLRPTPRGVRDQPHFPFFRSLWQMLEPQHQLGQAAASLDHSASSRALLLGGSAASESGSNEEGESPLLRTRGSLPGAAAAAAGAAGASSSAGASAGASRHGADAPRTPVVSGTRTPSYGRFRVFPATDPESPPGPRPASAGGTGAPADAGAPLEPNLRINPRVPTVLVPLRIPSLEDVGDPSPPSEPVPGPAEGGPGGEGGLTNLAKPVAPYRLGPLGGAPQPPALALTSGPAPPTPTAAAGSGLQETFSLTYWSRAGAGAPP